MTAPRLALILAVCAMAAFTLPAQTNDREIRAEDAKIRANPTYSAALLRHRDPDDLLLQWESKLAVDPAREDSEFLRFLALPRAAMFALEAGENEKAQRYAKEAMAFVDTHPKLPPGTSGDAPFYGNLVLGRLALLEGDVDRAEDYLLRSGLPPGCSVCGTFGPNMSLARELLKRSRTEAVLKFFEECKAFWHPSDEQGRLSRWSEEVKAGQMPVFRGNLFY